jgi:pilus assembly protein TadC
MNDIQLHLYAITVVTLIGLGIFVALIIALGLLLVAIVDGLVWLYDKVDEARNA